MHIDVLATFLAHGEYYHSVDEREERVILAHAYVESGMVLCASLTFQYVARAAVGAAEDFHTESFAF